MQTIGDLRAHADGKLLGGESSDALAAYVALVQLQPENVDARLRLADSLLALGKPQDAARVYTQVARHDANAGYPLRALVAVKVLAALEPSLGGLISGIAQLYGEGSPKLQGRAVRLSPGDPAQPLPDGFELNSTVSVEEILTLAGQVGTDLSSIAAYPGTLPPIPLLSDLPSEAFERVLSAVTLIRARPGQVILNEGEAGDSFFTLARGTVSVTRVSSAGGPVELATLHDGAVFGEMALVSAAPRGATVTTVTDADLLEFSRTALAAASNDLSVIARGLEKFTRERLLSNLLATAPLFQPLDRKQRLDLLRRFTAHEVQAGTPLIEEGRPGQGLYVVLHGSVDVTKVDGDEKVFLATLGPGEVFGEISLLHDAATSATVTAATRSTVLFLARDYFRRLVAAVPEIRHYVDDLGEERLLDTRLHLTETPLEGDQELWI